MVDVNGKKSNMIEYSSDDVSGMQAVSFFLQSVKGANSKPLPAKFNHTPDKAKSMETEEEDEYYEETVADELRDEVNEKLKNLSDNVVDYTNKLRDDVTGQNNILRGEMEQMRVMFENFARNFSNNQPNMAQPGPMPDMAGSNNNVDPHLWTDDDVPLLTSLVEEIRKEINEFSAMVDGS